MCACMHMCGLQRRARWGATSFQPCRWLWQKWRVRGGYSSCSRQGARPRCLARLEFGRDVDSAGFYVTFSWHMLCYTCGTSPVLKARGQLRYIASLKCSERTACGAHCEPRAALGLYSHCMSAHVCRDPSFWPFGAHQQPITYRQARGTYGTERSYASELWRSASRGAVAGTRG